MTSYPYNESRRTAGVNPHRQARMGSGFSSNLRLHVDVKRYRDGVFDVKMMRAPLGERRGITKALIRGQIGGSTSEPSVASALTYLPGRLSRENPEMWQL